MSGFAGVFQLDGAPVDPAWLETMADFLATRGPDGRAVWRSGSAGMCHTLLRTSARSDGSVAIPSLDGDLWIAGDARVDDRETLVAELGDRDLVSASSAELILHAYRAWGDACVEHLLGDFAFVIWDVRRSRVFCARDPLGVKYLFYARLGPVLLVSNSVDAIRQTGAVPDDFNDLAIGDYLLGGYNHDPATTFYAAIEKLPAAHRLAADRDSLKTDRYWNPPVDEPVYYRRGGEYAERFHELLKAAVRDRLPDSRVGIFMSGGLDSPAVAAAAVRLGADTVAFTSVFDRLIPDQERRYAGLAARYIGIPIRYNVKDDEPWGWEPGHPPIRIAEPTEDAVNLVARHKYFCNLSAETRVFFMGDGPDAALTYEWRPHLKYLLDRGRWGRALQDVALHTATQRRVPLLGSFPAMWRERAGKRRNADPPAFPEWIEKRFAAEQKLTERQRELLVLEQGKVPAHPIRPLSCASFSSDFPMCGNPPDWSEAESGREQLHPLGDLRMLRYLLSVPAIPWCRRKYLIRTALKDVLPDAVRRRPKAPVAGFPRVIRASMHSRPELPVSAQLAQFVETAKIPPWPGRSSLEFAYVNRILGLHYWLVGL